MSAKYVIHWTETNMFWKESPGSGWVTSQDEATQFPTAVNAMQEVEVYGISQFQIVKIPEKKKINHLHKPKSRRIKI